MRYRLIPVLAVLAAAAAGCSSSNPQPAAAGSPAAPAVSTIVDTTAPASDECTAFAQDYNANVSPVLKGNGVTGDAYATEMTDVFNALAAILTGPDPYSETVRKDALAIAADPSSYAGMATFTTDLSQFLSQCGMSAGTATS